MGVVVPWAGIRAHMQAAICDRYPASEFDMALECFPAPTEVNPLAYQDALKVLPRGSAVTIFTPDDTHFDIAMACVAAGMHVLVAKPVVKTLAHHRALMAAAREHNVLVVVEVHKRYDPFYTDCRDRIATLGDFSYMHAYMSQPKMQLQTFSSWLGSGASDISYYLNCHHIDFHEVACVQASCLYSASQRTDPARACVCVATSDPSRGQRSGRLCHAPHELLLFCCCRCCLQWCIGGKARPVLVIGSGSTGVAKKLVGADVEDTITLTVHWENLASGTQGGP
jgi:predicted dehydrogenase